MKWIEIIHIRSCTRLAMDQVREVFQELKASRKPKFLISIQLLKNLMIDSDLAIFMYWSNDVPLHGSSPLGLKLAASFTDYGFVNHVSWAVDSDSKTAER